MTQQIIVKEGAFDHDVRTQINDNFNALSASPQVIRVSKTYQDFTLDEGLSQYRTDTLLTLEPGDVLLAVFGRVTETFNDSNTPSIEVFDQDTATVAFTAAYDAAAPTGTSGVVGLSAGDGDPGGLWDGIYGPMQAASTAVNLAAFSQMNGDGTTGAVTFYFMIVRSFL